MPTAIISTTTAADVPTVCTIATALPILSPIIGLPSATRPLTIHRSGPGHQWAILTTSGIRHEPAPASCSASEPTPATAQPGYLTAATTESRHGIVVRPGTDSAVRATHCVGRVTPPTTRARNRDGAELPKPGTASASSSSSGSPSALSSGPTAVGMAPRWAKTGWGCVGGALARPKRVMWSFDADTSTWTNGWNVSAQTFESCTWENV